MAERPPYEPSDYERGYPWSPENPWHPEPDWTRRDLREVIDSVEADPRAPLFRLSPARVAQALDGAFTTWRENVLHVRAEGELLRVHRLEVAALLREAARMRNAGEPLGSLYPYATPGPEPRLDARAKPWFSGEPLEDWTCRAVEEIEGLRLDDMRVRGAPLLRRCLRTDPRRWPSAVDLARAALSAEDGLAGRLALGRALLSAGDADGAAELFLDLARRERARTPSDVRARAERWQVLEGLACCHEQRGSDRLALGACAAAATDPACGVGPLVSQFFLAVTLGDLQRARRAADRLELAAQLRDGGEDPAFHTALERLRTRVQLCRGGLPWDPPLSTAGLVSDLARGASTPARDVCLALAGPGVGGPDWRPPTSASDGVGRPL